MQHPTQEYIEAITEGLIQIAIHPEKRKEYGFVYNGKKIYMYKNEPMMSSAEQYGLAMFYTMEITHRSKQEDVDESAALAIEQIDSITDVFDANQASFILDCYLYDYYKFKKDKDAQLASLMWLIAYSSQTLHGANIDRLKELKSLCKQFPYKQDLYNLLAEIEDFVSKQKCPEDGDSEQAQKFIDNVFDYIYEVCDRYSFDEDDLWLRDALLQAYGVVDLPKRPRPKKGSFDQLYINAEKGDKESRHKLVEAYRNGIGVKANAKLADWWAQWK